ncbi:(+)-neomenthol dehydrogenase [Senna tora]|uniref:(+)-neomenthol dehydrogenase n=1 Tax=Senna tora TaxID=362788 RepID=A0A834TNR4_9FABA|nr:(+)-neomenthol dehydrogenase [Senna tora]
MEPEPYFPYSDGGERWWSEETKAVVTGGNKGIGFAVVKRLAELGVTVILAARDTHKGEAALGSLRAQGLGRHVHFLLLDVSDPLSITAFASEFQARFGPTLDILVNNAGVSFNDVHENSVEHAETVIKTNFYGPKLLIQALLPLFRPNSSNMIRILNVSSRLGSLNKVRNPAIRKVLEGEELEEDEIDETVRTFLRDVRCGRWKARGWPEHWTEYAVSKLALNAYSKVLAKRFEGSISVNCFCPGFTKTSMTRGKGNHSPRDAASLLATLALLPPPLLPTSKFFLLRSSHLAPLSKL